MIIMKKILKIISEVESFLDSVSKVILITGSISVCLCCASSLLIMLFNGSVFPDYDTAFYWSRECALLAKELLDATFIPVLIYELILTAKGIKDR